MLSNLPSRLLAVAVAALLLACLPAAASAEVPEGAEYTQEYIQTPDGVTLHLDVMRPKGVTGPTPVLAIISPYLGHSGGGTAADPGAPAEPSPRFFEFIKGAKLFERGWTVVQADLRGSGGSSGCLDILGPGEQTDIKTVVEWAASQPWSTGKVAMYGKSYDGNTGVAGSAIRPKGLAAVVAQQVVGDRYRGSYSGGVRYLQSFAYPSASYGTGAELGWTLQDDPEYTMNSVSSAPECQAFLAGHYDPDPNTDFWTSRDFVEIGRGSTVPMFMTLGYLDNNTNIGAGPVDYWNGLAGPKRLWIGWWDHVRGDDMVGEEPAMGRRGWYDEVMRFLDEHVRGIKPAVKDPVVAVQDSHGRWREETNWPPFDANHIQGQLKPGAYTDDGDNNGSADPNLGAGGSGAGGSYGTGIWTVSAPLPHTAFAAGIPQVRAEVAGLAQANIAANVYDIAPDGKATMISRGASLLGSEGTVDIPMYPTEWVFEPGHRVGVLISSSNSEAFLHQPTNSEVTVAGGVVSIPWLRYKRESFGGGGPAARLSSFVEAAPFQIAEDVIKGAEQAGLVPPAPVDAPVPVSGPATATPATPAPAAAAKGRLRIKLRAKGRRLIVTGTSTGTAKVKLVVKRGKKTLARRTVRVRKGAFRTTIRLRTSARRLTVTATSGGLRATARRR